MVQKEVTAQDVMSTNLVDVTPNTTVKKLAKTMADKRISCVLVGKGTGIITERDLVRKVIGAGKDAASLKAKDIMTSPVLGLENTTTMEDATEYMKKRKIRHLAIRKDGEIVGLITQTDIVRNTKKILEVKLTYDRISKIQLMVVIILAIVVAAIIIRN